MEKTIPKVSVIVPVYNAEKYIEKCINSVIAQTLQEWELILVNDASTDNSMETVKAMTGTDTRIKYIDNAENQGSMIVRFQGCRAATGEYISFLDSDDWLPDNALENLYSEAEKSGFDIVGGQMQVVSENGEKRQCLRNELNYGNDPKSVFKSLFLREFSQCLCSKLIKRSIISDNNYEISKHFTISEDMMFFFQIVGNSNSIACINDIVYFYRMVASSSTHKAQSENAISNVISANQYRLSFKTRFPEFSDIIDNEITRSFVELFQNPKNDYKMIIRMISKSEMNNYLTFNRIIKSMRFDKLIKTGLLMTIVVCSRILPFNKSCKVR